LDSQNARSSGSATQTKIAPRPRSQHRKGKGTPLLSMQLCSQAVDERSVVDSRRKVHEEVLVKPYQWETEEERNERWIKEDLRPKWYVPQREGSEVWEGPRLD
jgi:hypothetical protein